MDSIWIALIAAIVFAVFITASLAFEAQRRDRLRNTTDPRPAQRR